LKGFGGLLKWQTQSDTDFASEISDRVRVIACLDNKPNLIHSDRRDANISRDEWRAVQHAAGAGKDDCCIIVWGDADDVQTAVQEIAIRAKEATTGIPPETRQALKDGTTGFERILPGADRMYPDTDLPPQRITDEQLASAWKSIDMDYWQREERYRAIGVPEDVIVPLSISPLATLFEELVNEGVSPVLASVALIQFPKRLKKMGFNVSVLNEQVIRQIFNLYIKDKLPKDGIFQAMFITCKKGRFSLEQMPGRCTERAIKSAITKSWKQLASVKLHNPEKKAELMLALVMRRLRGRVNGVEIKKRI
ncbi:MAG: hypothetical protein ACE5DN_04535, partial [Flavobacteriales bacterium]